jgi:hypothetical protein
MIRRTDPPTGLAALALLGKGDVPVEPGRLIVQARVQATYSVEP